MAFLLVTLVLALTGCAAPVARPTTLPSPTAAPRDSGTQEPLGARFAPTREAAFPEATLVLAQGQVQLWAAWPMEGRDPQRSGHSDQRGPASPTILWSLELPDPSYAQVSQAPDGTLYVPSDSGVVTAVTSAGAVRWRFDTRVPGPVPTVAVGPNDTLYVRSADGNVHALRTDGSRRFTTDLAGDGRKLGPPLLVGPDQYSYTASYFSNLVYRLQPGGFLHWAHNVKARTPAGPAVRLDGVVYAGAADGTFRAIDREGFDLWTYQAPAAVVSPPSVALDGRAVFLVGGSMPHAIAVEAGGRELWRTPACWRAGRDDHPLWPSLSADGQVHVGNCAIKPAGEVAWSHQVDQPVTAAVVDRDGVAYFAAGPRLYAVSANGASRWTWDADSPLNPPSLGALGTLYVSSQSRLYAVSSPR